MRLSYLRKCTLEQAMFETKLNRRTIIRWWIRFRCLCADYFNAHPIQIGGPGTSVEIDETFLTTQKTQRGRRVRRHSHWIFGGTKRGSNRSFMVLVRRHRAVDLLPQILRHIRTGTTIYSDELRAYRGIVRLLGWFLYCLVHHFVDPVTRYTEYRERMGRVQILRSTKEGNPR
uniref:ISXO2-like transposase domain-containing protein n=1 Tax=Acrobeloides nanus TaxID=290746 RepID=A0A914ELN2_9BILA